MMYISHPFPIRNKSSLNIESPPLSVYSSEITFRDNLFRNSFPVTVNQHLRAIPFSTTLVPDDTVSRSALFVFLGSQPRPMERRP